jgi:hypothetical protein
MSLTTRGVARPLGRLLAWLLLAPLIVFWAITGIECIRSYLRGGYTAVLGYLQSVQGHTPGLPGWPTIFMRYALLAGVTAILAFAIVKLRSPRSRPPSAEQPTGGIISGPESPRKT